jgi:hypothetical protein
VTTRAASVIDREGFGPVVELSIPPSDAAGGPWSTIAYAVELRGYKLASGDHFRLTERDIDQMVANFSAYPKAPIVIEHADTREAAARKNPAWAEPHGHVVALRKGTLARTIKGAAVVVPSLEARFDAPPDVRLAINGDPGAGVPPKWPFCSITPASGWDDEHGVDLGCVLHSVSLTSHPRLTDLPRLAASKEHPMTTSSALSEGKPARELGYWYEEIKTRLDVLCMVRKVLELPVATSEADALAALDGLATPAEGVDAAMLLGNIRDALRLPATTATADVIQGVRDALAKLPAGPELARPAAPWGELARGLGLAPDGEDAARGLLLALARDGQAVRASLSLAADAPIAGRIAELVTDAAALPGVRAELARVTADVEARRAADAELAQKREADERVRAEAELSRRLDEVVLSRGLPDDVRPALEHYARTDRAGFDAKYPPPSPAELAQRAQDRSRTESLTGDDAGAGGTEGKPPTQAELARALSDEAARLGKPLAALDSLRLASRGVTPAQLASHLTTA